MKREKSPGETRQIATSGDLKSMMARANVSSKRLAQVCDVHPTTVSRWRSGLSKSPPIVMAYLKQTVMMRNLVKQIGERLDI